MSFQVAMHYQIAVAKNEPPYAPITVHHRLGILTRTSSNSGMISLSVAGPCNSIIDTAPGKIPSKRVSLAQLVSNGVDGEELFLFASSEISPEAVVGTFIPAQGYCSLMIKSRRPILRAFFRLMDCAEASKNNIIHLQGQYIPWKFELFTPHKKL